MMYGLVGLIIVVLGALVGWNLGYSYLPFDCKETRGDIGIVLGGNFRFSACYFLRY